MATRILKSAVAALLLVSGPLYAKGSPLSDKDGTALLSKIRDSLEKVQTLKLPFEQKRVLKLFKDELKSSGTLYFQQPSKLRWEVSKPFKTLLIYNDKGVGKFKWDDAAKLWVKMDFGGEDLLREIMNNILAWHRGDFSSAKEMYNMDIYPQQIILTPTSAKMKQSLSEIELHFDPKSYRMQKVVLNEAKGDFVEIAFAVPEIDPIVTEKHFNLSTPAN